MSKCKEEIMKDLQEKVRAFAQVNNLSPEIQVRLPDLVSEVGELCKEYIKITEYGKKRFTPNEDFELELGDVFFSLILIANSAGIDLEESLDRCLQKLEKRFEIVENKNQGGLR